jgi:hypothetical protein
MVTAMAGGTNNNQLKAQLCGRGDSNSSSRQGGQWAGRAMLCSLLVFSPIIFFTVTTTATEGRGDSAAAVVSYADPFS